MICGDMRECLPVQYLVAFVVGLIGDLITLIAPAVGEFGSHLLCASEDVDTMLALTTGIFGTNSGLIYWINNKVFYLIENMPWCELGAGLGGLLEGLKTPAC
jgi:hypothetical protein